jgi:hypothetical protein
MEISFGESQLITKDSEIVKEFFSTIDRLLDAVEKRIETHKPLLNGERFLTGEEVCDILHLSKRTLKEYRDAGRLSFISLPGKVLYRESDIQNLLNRNFQKAWNNHF